MSEPVAAPDLAAMTASLADDTIIDFSRLDDLAAELGPGYRSAQPFPHVVMDEFVSAAWSRTLSAVFPTPDEDRNWRRLSDSYADGDTSQAGKMGLPNPAQLSPLIREFLLEMNSAEFLRFLEQLTGILGLLPDPKFKGGGAHQTLPGGYLGVHADFTEHRYYKLSRRLNVLLYLNEDWPLSWGGHLELWRRDLSACVRRVAPVLGRCVVFSTDNTSFHGHPDPLACPENVTRRSIALYYYTHGRADDTPPVSHTDWRKVSREQLPEVE